MYKSLLVGTFCILLWGCSASGPKFSELPSIQQGTSSVLIYRPYAFVNGGAFPYIYVDDEKRGRLLNAGYVSLDVTPGRHSIVLKNFGFWDGAQQWTVETKESQQYFFRVVTDLDSMQVYGPLIYTSKSVAIQRVPKEVALQQLAELKLSN
jgi:hypothetical protein